ncbi:MAG: type II secretion system protein [Bacteriovorax sp.]
MVNSTRISTNRGFGLVEAMISVAVIGLITVAVISQQRMAAKSSFNVASDTEINNLTNKVIAEISDQGTCSRVLSGSAGNYVGNFGGAPFVNSYTKLIGRGGNDLIVQGATYGSSLGQVIVDSISTRLKPSTSGVDTNEIILTLAFRRKEGGGTVFSSNDVKREIALNIITLDGTTISSCYGNFDLVIKTAIQLSCQGNSSFYDANQNIPYGACVHKNQTTTCPAGQFLKIVDTDPTTKEIQYTCVDVHNYCTGANQFIKSFNSDGTITCDSVLIETCAPGQVIVKNSAGVQVCTTIDCRGISPISAFAGFQASGGQVCNQITSLKNCGTDNFATKVNTDGSITCAQQAVSGGSCPVGKRIQGITAAGTIDCQFFINLPMDCGPGNGVTGIDANGDRTCAQVNRPLACNAGWALHTYKQCSAWGGTITNPYTPNSMCTFNSASCPGGWFRCESWGTQTTNSCTDSGTSLCAQPTRYAVPSWGSGVFQNTTQTSVDCYTWTATTGPYFSPIYCAPHYWYTVYSNQTQVGCF